MAEPLESSRVSYDGEAMVLDESLLPEIVRRIRTVTEPDRVILFGSAASGQMSPDSDIDILVVAPTPANTRDESVRIRRALGDLGHPVDVIVIATERFEETRGVIGGIAYPADRFGKVLYAVA
jgi:predicted nucleotidyltransferase